MAFQKKTPRMMQEEEDRRLLVKILNKKAFGVDTSTPARRIPAIEAYIEDLEALREEIRENYPGDSTLALNRLDVRIASAIRLLVRERLSLLDAPK